MGENKGDAANAPAAVGGRRLGGLSDGCERCMVKHEEGVWLERIGWFWGFRAEVRFG